MQSGAGAVRRATHAALNKKRRPKAPESPNGTGAQPAAEHAWLLDVVQGADALVHALDLHQAEDERVPDLDPALWQRLDLSPARCARVLAVTEQGVAALAEALAA